MGHKQHAFFDFEMGSCEESCESYPGTTGRRIREDWNERWGYRPVLMETFVDPARYHGSCYKASNWEYLGMTTGEGLVRKGKKYTTTPKMIFVKPLAKEFRSLLCSDQLKGRVEG